MTPLDLDFGFNVEADQADRKIRRTVEDAVAVLSLGVAAGLCGCTPAQLRDAMDGRNGRRLPTDWVMRIARKVGGDLRDRIQDALNDFMDPGAPATDAQLIESLKTSLKAFGLKGEEELAAVLRRLKR